MGIVVPNRVQGPTNLRRQCNTLLYDTPSRTAISRTILVTGYEPMVSCHRC